MVGNFKGGTLGLMPPPAPRLELARELCARLLRSPKWLPFPRKDAQDAADEVLVVLLALLGRPRPVDLLVDKALLLFEDG